LRDVGLRDLFRRKPQEQVAFDVTSRTDDSDEQNRQVFETLREEGSDLSRPRSTDFYVYFRTREGADAAAEAVRAEGYDVRSSADPESERPWLVLASRQLVVEEGSIEEAEAFFRKLAEQHDGEYDGWETGVG
jgi:regulator of RNase E activity RraB